MNPTDADRELAREWADAQSWLDREQRRLAENAYALGLAAGQTGPTWTGTPPGEPETEKGEFWWVRRSLTAWACVVDLDQHGYLYGPGVECHLSDFLRLNPACLWAGPILPPPHPAPREPT